MNATRQEENSINTKSSAKWRRGDIGMLGFVFSIIFLTIIFISILFLAQINMSKDKMDSALSMVSRRVVVCEDMKEAKRVAYDEAHKLLKEYNDIGKGIKTEVTYVNDKNKEWKKGALVRVSITTNLRKANTFLPTRRTVSTIVMVE